MADDRIPVHHQHHAPPTARRAQMPHPAVLALARLIGRQMAREHFAALTAANDNAGCGPPDDTAAPLPDTS